MLTTTTRQIEIHAAFYVGCEHEYVWWRERCLHLLCRSNLDQRGEHEGMEAVSDPQFMITAAAESSAKTESENGNDIY